MCWELLTTIFIVFIAVCDSKFSYGDVQGTLPVLMPGAHPTKTDDYICTSVQVPDDLYIIHFTPQADMRKVHHMLLYGCADARRELRPGIAGTCNMGVCKSGQSILFAWARNAPPPVLPDGVGFHIGGDSGINYLTLQMHYGDISAFSDGVSDNSGMILDVTTTRQEYIGGVYLIGSENINIPPYSLNVHADVACKYTNTPIHVFAFRTHSHDLGKVITGYRIKPEEGEEAKWTILGKGNPQWPQAFYPMSQIYTIKKGDILAARCTYDAQGVDHTVRVGATHLDEMCNFYMMYFADHGTEAFQSCWNSAPNGLLDRAPPGYNTPPAHMPKISRQENIYESYYYFEDDDDDLYDPNHNDIDTNILAMEGDLKQNVMDQIQDIDSKQKTTMSSAVKQQTPTAASSKAAEKVDETRSRVFNVVPDWPILGDLKFGQVAGVGVDSHGDVYAFHRADRVWDRSTFEGDTFKDKDTGPIPTDTVAVLEKNNGTVKKSWGANLFYLPHGLTIDHEDNVWVTDVALHQVFKFPPGGGLAPLMTLGTRMEPGTGPDHFCKPADVAVHPETGDIFVADGYCNSRIMKFSKDGELVLEIGKSNPEMGHLPPPTELYVVHSITLAAHNQQVCIADRENGRILCFDSASGHFIREYKQDVFGGRVFAVQYSPTRGGVLFVVNGKSQTGKAIKGFTLNFTSGALLETWKPSEGFNQPHDVAVTPDGNIVYVGEIGPNKVWKFFDPAPAKNTDPSLPENLARNDLLSHEAKTKGFVTAPEDYGVTAIIVTVLAVPIVLMMVIAIMVRLHAQNKLGSGKGMFVIGGRGRNYKTHNSDSFSIGNFFNKRKGFTQVSTEESDYEAATWSEESDVEEYSILNSKRTQNL